MRRRLVDGLLFAVLGVLGWAACGATMFAGMTLASTPMALVVHALLAPVFFGLAAFVYHRREHARLGSFRSATMWVGLVIALDVGVVALLIERSFEMFASVAGTWLPFTLMFLSSWLVGASTRARVRERAEPGPERQAIEAFFGKKRIAFVGLSSTAGPGSVSDDALALFDAHGLAAVKGRCPLMFLPDTSAGHRMHGQLLKLAGTYPH